MYLQDVHSGLAEVTLSVVELALLVQVCRNATIHNGTDAEQALVEALGAGFQGAAMAASALDVLLVEDADRVRRQWKRHGLVVNANGVFNYPAIPLDELKDVLVGKDVYLDSDHYDVMGVVTEVESDGVIQEDTGHSGAIITIGIDALVALKEADEVKYIPCEPSDVKVDVMLNGIG